MKTFRAAVAIVFIGYAILLFRNTSFVAGGPDESGYMNAARMFAAGKLRLEAEPLRRLNLDPSYLPVFTPLGFVSAGDRWIVPGYPPGLPLHLIFGGYLVAPILALGSLVFTFMLGRELGLPEWSAVAAAAILAVTPQFILFALQVMSDVPATFWALLTIWLALVSHRRAALAIAAGAAFAIGVAVRPASALVAIPLVLALRAKPALTLRAAAGTLPLIGLLGWYQNELYGSPFATGYGIATNVLTFDGFATKLTFYGLTMAKILTPIIAPLGILIALDRKVNGWHRAMLVSWIISFFVFYCTWGLFDEWWYTRFLLPATPPLIIATLLLLRDLVPHRAAALALIAIMIYVPWFTSSRYRVLRIDDDQRTYSGAMWWSAKVLPDDAMVVAGLLSGTFLLYQNRLTARWDNLDAGRFEPLRGRATWYAVLSDVEVEMTEFERRLPGPWVPIARFRNVTIYRLQVPV